jgi:hypothetical protein
MSDGMEEIREAAESLAVMDEKLRARLTEAGKVFWSATFHYDDWPESLRRRADRILARILADGPVKETIGRMDLQEAKETAREILEFIVDFERSQGGPPSSD